MNFIEVLRAVGGVKPCNKCYSKHATEMTKNEGIEYVTDCDYCHGTGTVLDLVSLLAKPKELTSCLGELLDANSIVGGVYHGMGNLHVVGPQRASNLVYEVARQLGGTAAVAEPNFVKDDAYLSVGGGTQRFVCYQHQGYRLSLPIPDSATVLFVTDRVDVQEVKAIAGLVKVEPLPYLLCLVADRRREGVVALYYGEDGR